LVEVFVVLDDAIGSVGFLVLGLGHCLISGGVIF
jgi:hypothetical protein